MSTITPFEDRVLTIRAEDIKGMHNTDAETALIGALVSGARFEDIAHLVGPTDFVLDTNRAVFEAAARLHLRGIALDFITLRSELFETGKLETAGGESRLLQATLDGSAVLASDYARMAAELAYRRRLFQFAEEVAAMAHDGRRSLNDIHDTISDRLGKMGGKLTKTFRTAKSIFGDFVDVMLDRYNRAGAGNPNIGLNTGFPQLNEAWEGDFVPARYAIVFGPTKIGKSWLLIQLALAAARQVPVVYFTLENTEESVRERMAAVTSGAPLTHIKTGRLSEAQIKAVLDSSGLLADLELEVVEHVNHAGEILAHLKGATARYGRPGLAFVDTINEMADSQAKDSRYENLTRASGRLLAIMRQTGWGIVAAAQMRNSLEPGLSAKEAKKVSYPNKHSLEGARTLTQHVTNLWGLYSPDYVRREINSDDYADPECPSGAVKVVNVGGRDSASETDALISWNPNVPRFEPRTGKWEYQLDYEHDAPKMAGRDY